MALGSMFDGFWRVVEAQVGTKFAPKSKKMGCQDDVKKTMKIWSHGGWQGFRGGSAVVPGSWPLKTINTTAQEHQRDRQGIGTLPCRAQGPGADIYIYIYIYVCTHVYIYMYLHIYICMLYTYSYK